MSRQNATVVQDPLWRTTVPVSAGSGETSPVPGRVPVVCPTCGARIGSERGCHCPTCHQNFGDIDAFDTHRRNGHCLTPARVGLVELDRGGWIRWVSAGGVS